MANFKVAWNASTKVATVQNAGDATTPGSVALTQQFHHDDTDDKLGAATGAVTKNHVLYHHVRNALYKAGVQDMQHLSIVLDTDYVALVDYTVVPATVTKAAGQTQQITHVFNPTNASNKGMSYVSSAPTKATVSPSGLITAVATGSATITCTSADGQIVHTCVVTVS